MPKGKRTKPIRKRGWDPEHDIDEAYREPRRFRTGEGGSGKVGDESLCFAAEKTNAVVVCPYGLLAFVDQAGEERLCRVAEDLTDGRTSILTPGDAVWIEQDAGQWLVRAVAPRRTQLSRYLEGSGREQVVAANIDLLVVVASPAKPRFKPGFVDRCLIAAEAGGVGTLLCLNKMDLVDQPPPGIDDYERLGIRVIKTSCLTGAGIPDLCDALRDKLSILCGQSGVGKSSLIKAVEPALDIAVQEVSRATEKGRHTTTASRMYRLRDNIRIIDTPGVKTLGLWGVSPEELYHYFPEFQAYAAACRFRDCTHIHEPNCGVRAALERGEILPRRYESYRRIRAGIEEAAG